MECFTLGLKVLQAETQLRDSKGKLVARSEERNRETIPTPRFARKPTTMNSFFPAERVTPTELRGRSTKTSDLGASSRQIPTPSTRVSCRIQYMRPRTVITATRSVLVPVLPRRQCYGSKKWRWSIQWTV